MRWGVRPLALLVVIALVACTGGDETNGGDGGDGAAVDAAAYEDSTTEELAEELRSDFDDDNIAAMIEAFSRAGVAVYDDELTERLVDVDGEASALQLIQFQARNMALELSADGGHLGAQLEDLARSKKSPSISQGLIEYADGEDTFGAELSALLLADRPRDPTAVVFPTAVLALFLSDAAVEAGVEPPDVQAADDEHVIVAAGQEVRVVAASICDQISNFIGATGRAILGGIIRQLPYVREVMFGLTLIVTAGSLLRTWTVTVTADPTQTHYGVEEVVEGRFEASVDTGGSFRWPASVQSCARLVGLELPEPEDAPGSQISWVKHAGIPEHIQLAGQVLGRINDESKADMRFTVTQEDSAAHEGGSDERVDAVVVEARVLRGDAVDLIRMIGEIAGPILNFPGAGAAIGSVAEFTAGLMSPSGYATVVVRYHELGSATISWSRGGASFTAYSCSGPRGPWRGSLTVYPVGGTDFEFSFPSNGNTTQVSGNFGAGSFTGTATLVGDRAIEFVITTSAGGGGGTGTATAQIKYGRVQECR